MQCPALVPPPNSEMSLSCNDDTAFGSSCQIFCQDGYYGNGDGRVSCNTMQGVASVSWATGNFSCQGEMYFVVSPQVLLFNKSKKGDIYNGYSAVFSIY